MPGDVNPRAPLFLSSGSRTALRIHSPSGCKPGADPKEKEYYFLSSIDYDEQFNGSCLTGWQSRRLLPPTPPGPRSPLAGAALRGAPRIQDRGQNRQQAPLVAAQGLSRRFIATDGEG